MQSPRRVSYNLSDAITETDSGVATAFPGGHATHPKDQNEEENEHKIEEN